MRFGLLGFLRLDLHWSEDEQMYCDASVDSDGPSALSSLLSLLY